jgi:hypothetical protein
MSNHIYTILIKPYPTKASLNNQDRVFYEAHLLPADETILLELQSTELYSPEQHIQRLRYQNRFLEGELSDEFAEDALSMIKCRGELLWESLCQQLSLGTRVPKDARLVFDIYEHRYAISLSGDHISPCWEQLERFELHPGTQAYPTIRRIHTASPTTYPDQQVKPIPHYLSQDNILWINVLLVRARELTLTAFNNRQEVDCCLAHDIISAVRDLLEDKDRPIRIHMEVVRRGSLEALEQHLKDKGAGYFSLIHFDVHGFTRPDSRWVVHFTPPEQLTLGCLSGFAPFIVPTSLPPTFNSLLSHQLAHKRYKAYRLLKLQTCSRNTQFLVWLSIHVSLQ